MPTLTFGLVTPTLNSERFLAATLDSIRHQRVRPIEYLICDGDSTDNTHKILESNRDVVSRVMIGKDGGMYEALHKGLGQVQGDVLGWLNSDDLLLPWAVSCVLRYFEAIPECEWLTGVPAMFDASGDMVWTPLVAPHYRRKWIERGWYGPRGLGPIQQESTFFRRRLYERVGGLNSKYKLAGDYDLWRRFSQHAELHQLGTVVGGFRFHGTNLSGDLRAYCEEAGGRRVPFGASLGIVYSFLANGFGRISQRKRLKDIAIPSAPVARM
jgi:glycosyltransferase involved in cell wall biosynthesis